MHDLKKKKLTHPYIFIFFGKSDAQGTLYTRAARTLTTRGISITSKGRFMHSFLQQYRFVNSQCFTNLSNVVQFKQDVFGKNVVMVEQLSGERNGMKNGGGGGVGGDLDQSESISSESPHSSSHHRLYLQHQQHQQQDYNKQQHRRNERHSISRSFSYPISGFISLIPYAQPDSFLLNSTIRHSRNIEVWEHRELYGDSSEGEEEEDNDAIVPLKFNLSLPIHTIPTFSKTKKYKNNMLVKRTRLLQKESNEQVGQAWLKRTSDGVGAGGGGEMNQEFDFFKRGEGGNHLCYSQRLSAVAPRLTRNNISYICK